MDIGVDLINIGQEIRKGDEKIVYSFKKFGEKKGKWMVFLGDMEDPKKDLYFLRSEIVWRRRRNSQEKEKEI